VARAPVTTCPSCDAPVPARARNCLHCGYRFFEDGGPADHLPRPDRATLTIGAAAAVLVIVAVAAIVLLTGGGAGENTASATATSHLTVLSAKPLRRLALERVLEARYLPIPDDDEADVTCSSRIPKPAHSVRRCIVHYPGGAERRIAVLTNARGAEVLSKP
jgi:ribosomal protein L40E